MSEQMLECDGELLAWRIFFYALLTFRTAKNIRIYGVSYFFKVSECGIPGICPGRRYKYLILVRIQVPDTLILKFRIL